MRADIVGFMKMIHALSLPEDHHIKEAAVCMSCSAQIGEHASHY